ncbi:ankyrin repeat-containing domain protein [Aspergillus californicus]
MGAEINDNLSLPSLEAYSTLHHAVKSGNLETVELLLDHGADLNAKSSDGDFTHLEYEALTVLEYAALTGHLEISNLIISRGSKITEPLLGCAAFSGNVDLVRACLSKGAPLNGCDWENRTALHQAAIEGNIPIMKLFLEAGAQLDKRETRFGQTALLFAVQERRFEPIRLLLDYGADVDCPDSAGYTPLHVVVDNADVDSDKEYTQIVRLLLERGANVFATIITGILR